MDAIAKIRLSHQAWIEILSQSIPTQWDSTRYESELSWSREVDRSDIIHQWDPDRALDGQKLD